MAVLVTDFFSTNDFMKRFELGDRIALTQEKSEKILSVYEIEVSNLIDAQKLLEAIVDYAIAKRNYEEVEFVTRDSDLYDIAIALGFKKVGQASESKILKYEFLN